MLRIFLSHVRDDGVLAHRLAEALKRAGPQPLLVEDVARVGESALEVLERCLGEADVVVLCLSRAALADAWMQTEFQKVLSRFGACGQRVLAVRFERVVPPEAMAHCLSVDVFPHGGAWDEGASVLLEVLEQFDKGRATNQWVLRPGNIPPPPGVFVGRKEILRQLHEVLAPPPEKERGRRATLVGEEGMGRSSTALRFAHETAERFPGGLWWCDAQGQTAEAAMALLLPALQRLAPLGLRSMLELVGPSSPLGEVAQAVRQALAQLQLPSLLVIDDAEQSDWSSHLPAGRVCVLLTRSEPEGAIGEVIPLGPLTPAESSELVDALSAAPEEPREREARLRVSQELLGGQPFAMTLMTRFQQESGTPWGLLEQALRGRLEEALSSAGAEQVRTVVDETLERCTSAMRRLLETVASFEASIPIPLEWLVAIAEPGAEELELEQTSGALVFLGLTRWDEERNTISLHPIVRQRVRELMEPSKHEGLLRRSMEAMVSWISQRMAHLRPENLAEVEAHQPHFQQSLLASEHWPPSSTWVLLAVQVATILEIRLELPAALEWSRRALARADQLGAPREQLQCLMRLAHILHRMGQDDVASPYLQRAVQLVDELPDEGDEGFAIVVYNLAALAREREPALARRLAERALQEAERLTEPDDVLTGAVLANLALIHKDAGDTSAALPLIQRALELTERGAGRASSLFVERLMQQAQILTAMNDWPRARDVLQQALSLSERLLPADHVEIGALLAQLALVLMNLGEFVAAKPLLEKAVGLLEAKLGPEHPLLGPVLNDLGIAFLHARQQREAAATLSRALGLLEKTRPWDKQLLAAAQAALAMASEAMGDARSAALLFEKALDTGLMFYAPAEGSGKEALEKALRLARARQVNPEAYVSALVEALETAEQGGDTANAARAALLLGAFEGRRGAWEKARSHVERGLRWAKQAEAPMLVAESHRLLGDASLHGSRYEDARLHYAEAARRWEELGLSSRAGRIRMLLLVMMLQLGRTEGLAEQAAALKTALEEGRFTEPAERVEVEQILRLVDATQRGALPGPQGNTE